MFWYFFLDIGVLFLERNLTRVQRKNQSFMAMFSGNILKFVFYLQFILLCDVFSFLYIETLYRCVCAANFECAQETVCQNDVMNSNKKYLCSLFSLPHFKSNSPVIINLLAPSHWQSTLSFKKTTTTNRFLKIEVQ